MASGENMKQDENCIFCKIARGEVSSDIVYEDDEVIAFEDANPQMPIHTLIIPKDHYAHIGDEIPEQLMGHLFSTVEKVASIKGVSDSGYRVIVNTGKDAQQTVHHIHIHVLGGSPMNIKSPAL